MHINREEEVKAFNKLSIIVYSGRSKRRSSSKNKKTKNKSNFKVVRHTFSGSFWQRHSRNRTQILKQLRLQVTRHYRYTAAV